MDDISMERIKIGYKWPTLFFPFPNNQNFTLSQVGFTFSVFEFIGQQGNS